MWHDNDCKVNTYQIKPKGKSKIDNPEQLATLATQDTRRRQTHKNKTQHRKLKR